jgi:hypothetical protein
MLLAFAAAASTGLLLGFLLQAPALFAASVVAAVVVSLSVASLTDLGPASAVGLTFALLSALQVGFLIGLLLACAWARMRISVGLLQLTGLTRRPTIREVWRDRAPGH